MPIRPATYSDLIPAAKVLGRAFNDEPLFGDVMHPYRSKYPDDVYLHFLHELRIAYVSGADNVLFVAYKKGSQDQEQITGLAHWHRYRSTSHRSLYTTGKVKSMTLYNYLESFIYPNRAADPTQADILPRAGPFIAHHWTGTRADCWDLSLLAVDPNQGRQGFGRELVKWGFEKAKEEGVGCSVISSEGKERFYQTCGFDVVAGKARDEGGAANPLRLVSGGTIHFWDNGRGVEGVKKYGEV